MRDDLKCGHCGSERFSACVTVNDCPIPGKEDHWQVIGNFFCLQCNERVFDVSRSKRGRLSVFDDLCRSRLDLREYRKHYPEGQRWDSPVISPRPIVRPPEIHSARLYKLTLVRLLLFISCGIGIGILVSLIGFSLFSVKSRVGRPGRDERREGQ
jgi:hypothetical protein